MQLLIGHGQVPTIMPEASHFPDRTQLQAGEHRMFIVSVRIFSFVSSFHPIMRRLI